MMQLSEGALLIHTLVMAAVCNADTNKSVFVVLGRFREPAKGFAKDCFKTILRKKKRVTL